MARIDELRRRYTEYIECESSILSGAQSYKIGSREFNRANLSHIKEMIDYLEKEIAKEEAKALGKRTHKVIGVIPRDV